MAGRMVTQPVSGSSAGARSWGASRDSLGGGAFSNPYSDNRPMDQQVKDPLTEWHQASGGVIYVPYSWTVGKTTQAANAGAAVKAFRDAAGGGATGGGSSASGSGPTSAVPPRVGASTTTSGSGTSAGLPGKAGLADPNAINAQAQAAQDAALGRAKENAGLIARSALTGLHEALGERQMLGSGAEAQATGDVAMKGAGLINDVNVAGLDKQSNLAQRLAELSYTGRGQDINRELGILNADVAQRGQDITARGQDYSYQAAMAGNPYNDSMSILNALKNIIY